MTIEVPKNCRRLVKAYERFDYQLVQSDHPRHLLKMDYFGPQEGNAAGSWVPKHKSIYITMGRSPLSLVNRDGYAANVLSTGNKVPYYSANERKRAAELVFGPRT